MIAFAITLFTKKPRADHYMVTDDEYFITSPKILVQDKGDMSYHSRIFLFF